MSSNILKRIHFWASNSAAKTMQPFHLSCNSPPNQLPSVACSLLSNANWGPQDQSVPTANDPEELLELFKSRSIADYIVWLGGPIDWNSKRQSFTARNSAHAEIGVVNDCTKCIQHISNTLQQDLNVFPAYTSGPITIHNDNNATVLWSHNMTTKRL